MRRSHFATGRACLIWKSTCLNRAARNLHVSAGRLLIHAHHGPSSSSFKYNHGRPLLQLGLGMNTHRLSLDFHLPGLYSEAPMSNIKRDMYSWIATACFGFRLSSINLSSYLWVGFFRNGIIAHLVAMGKFEVSHTTRKQTTKCR